MVMDNPNSYARPIKHLEKGMDFGVSSKCFSVYHYIIEKNPDECCCRGKIKNILQNKEFYALAPISYCYFKLYNPKSFKTCVLFKCNHLGI